MNVSAIPIYATLCGHYCVNTLEYLLTIAHHQLYLYQILCLDTLTLIL